MGKSVAIVGFAAATRERVYESEADEIWSLNMLHSSPVLRSTFALNIHRLFELHPVWMLRTPWYLPSGHDHWRWMTRIKHHYPVYMIAAHPDVHNSITYPLDAVCDDLLPNLTRQNERVAYFTSSMCYMVALAIHERFERVEVYGFEMGSDTEYVYQKAGGEFWLGLALGRGVDVCLPGGTRLLRARLYGFEDGQLVSHEDLVSWRQRYQDWRAEIREQPEDQWGADEYINMYLSEGAIKLLEEMIDTGEPVSRQVLESYKLRYANLTRRAEGAINAINARATERIRANGDEHDLRTTAGMLIHHLYTFDGAWQLAQKLISVCDLQEPNWFLLNRHRWTPVRERTGLDLQGEEA